MPRKLLVPVKISTGKRGISEKRGTRAFVEQGNEKVGFAEDFERSYFRGSRNYLRRAKRKVIRPGRLPELRSKALGLDSEMDQLLFLRSELAQSSPFFMKRISERVRRIRGILLKNGINVESPLNIRNIDARDRKLGRVPASLGQGFELFEGKHSHIPVNSKNYESIKFQIIQTVSKMHSLGITHNHLHYGNWLYSADGNIQLIDLSKAKSFKTQPSTKSEFLSRFSNDLFVSSSLLVGLKREWIGGFGVVMVGRPDLGELAVERAQILEKVLNSSKAAKRLRISSRDIVDYYFKHFRKV